MCHLWTYFCCVQLSSCLQTSRTGGARLLVCSLLFRIATVCFVLVLVVCVCVCVKHGPWNNILFFKKIKTSGIFMVVFSLFCLHVILFDFHPWAFRCKIVLLLFTCVRQTEPSCCCYRGLFPRNRRRLAWRRRMVKLTWRRQQACGRALCSLLVSYLTLPPPTTTTTTPHPHRQTVTAAASMFSTVLLLGLPCI